MMAFCQDPTREYLSIIFVSLASIFVTTLIIIFISFIKKLLYVSKQRPPKVIIISAIFLYLVIIIGMTMHTIFVSDLCISQRLKDNNAMHDNDTIYNHLVNFSYSLQCLLLLWLWFIRLYYAFTGTLFELSKITIIGYISIFSLSFLFVVLMLADISFDTSEIDRSIHLLMLLLLIIWFIILIISLASLFIRKLINVYRNLDSDQYFIAMVTKITILNFVSLSITIIWAFSLIFFDYNVYTEFVNHFGIIFDYFSTFICAILSFNCYETYYTQICGKFHNQCNQCWLHLVRESLENKGQIVPTHISDKSGDSP